MPKIADEKVAIMVDEYRHPTQTFIDRHIQELFGGNSVVICNRKNGKGFVGKPYFCRSEQNFEFSDLLRYPLEHASNLYRFSSNRTIAGTKRIKLERFLLSEGVTKILVELGQYGPDVFPIARSLNIPVFVYFRGYDATGYLCAGRRQSRRTRALEIMFKNVSGIFSVSRFLLDELAKHGLEHPNSYVVPSGVDTSRFAPGKKRTGTVLAVGRLVEKKAPEITIRSFLKASADLPDARLEIIGDGPLMDACRSLAQSHRDGNKKIVFHGERPHDFVRQRQAECDIFAQHSVTAKNGDQEGAPTAIQEAMSCGAAILSTRHAGIPYIVEEGKAGYLVNEFDEDEFVDRLRTMLTNPDVSRAFGSYAREYALENFDYKKLYAKVESIISGESARPA
ncbi:MAG: glycosyltransferase [Paracoccaceae bacterium]|nr:glycosyltransferase [Paracoccaceae bacterium]